MFLCKKNIYLLLTLALILSAVGCTTISENGTDQDQKIIETFNGATINLAEETAQVEKKIGIINSKEKKIGMAILSQFEKGVLLKIFASGIEPGRHGFHFHETAKCEAPTFESAGSHFNPTNKKHGFNNPDGYHAGDLGNLVVGKDGVAEAEIFFDYATLQEGQATSLLDKDGSALVIHTDPDDYITEPAGDAGDRIACGVIQ
jgi:Cu-Zn family superoxide dismutase